MVNSTHMLIGMTMGQLDDYAFLVARLSRRYDPPEDSMSRITKPSDNHYISLADSMSRITKPSDNPDISLADSMSSITKPSDNHDISLADSMQNSL